MRKVTDLFRNFARTGDLVLLFLCLVTNSFGCLIVASATRHLGSSRLIIVQLFAMFLGVLLYIILTNIDVEIFTERRGMLLAFNVLLMAMLIPFGTDNGSGNKSWIDFPLLPVNIQPAEICKITFVMILAKVMAIHQTHLSSLRSVTHMSLHAGIMIGMIMVLSHDAGVALIFVFIFIVMVYVAGLNYKWILAGVLALAALLPLVWNYMMDDYQRNRILVLFDSSIDPQGLSIRWHMKNSLLSLTAGGITGQGLFRGNRTQIGALTAQHTDFIFSAIGEELGFFGCLLTLVLLTSIIVRCVYVGMRTTDYCNRMICVGVASATAFQVISNVGMCLGLMPVIGLTLPFISYGGSSIVSMYLSMGIISSIYARPDRSQHDRYIHGPM